MVAVESGNAGSHHLTPKICGDERLRAACVSPSNAPKPGYGGGLALKLKSSGE